MNLEQLDRLFTAVSAKHHVKTFIVMGSLTVLALVGARKIPEAMTVSAEVDAYPESDPGRAFEIADDFGLGSEFEQEYGYYYDAVSPNLPTLPRGAPKDLQWIRAGVDASILSVATLEYRFRETVFADDSEREKVREVIAREKKRSAAKALARRKAT